MHEIDEIRDSLKSNKSKTKKSYLQKFPKANQILQALNYRNKSIYPFHMKNHKHRPMSEQQQPYNLQSGKAKVNTFQPLLPTVQMHFDKKYLIYDKFNNNWDDQLFNENIFGLEKLKNLKNMDYMSYIDFTGSFSTEDGDLQFDSRFESGNLSMASQILDVYYLLLHHDVNTSGYTNWFYFSVKNKKKGTKRFAILNYGKAGLVHNDGVKICVHDKNGWKRGGMNILCCPNVSLFEKGKYLKFNTLYFEYQFEEDNSEVFFSYNIPYNYTDLCHFLDEIEVNNLLIFHRKLAGVSLAGNRIQEITVTNFEKQNHSSLPVIILMARAHPGETVSSWIMHEFISFIISDDPQACNLRNKFIFKLFPMMNPDGVIHGNYRCSLSGRDLNRRWSDPNKEIFPEVFFIKKIIVEIGKKKSIKMILDLHGHTQKKEIFAYGCNDKREPQRCRLFPYIISKLSPFFEFRFCNYFMDKSKMGTARISLFHLLKIPYTYTIQTSQFGTMEGHLSLKVFRQFSRSIAKSFAILFKAKNMEEGSKQFMDDVDLFYSELTNDFGLLKIGSEQDNGSDSEPSVDNIKLDQLNKMAVRKSKNIHASPNTTERLQSQANDFQILQKLKPSITMRPKTTSLRDKNGEKQSRKLSFLQTRFSSFRSQLDITEQEKADRSVRIQRKETDRTQIFSSKKKTEKLNFINLSFTGFDDTKSMRATKRIPEVYRHRQNEELFQKIGIGRRKFNQFRKLN